MLKNFKTSVALFMAGASFIACSNDENDIANEMSLQQQSKTYTMTIRASKGDDVSTRALSLDGKTLNATWSAGEPVLVYQDETQVGTLYSEASETSNTTLTGSVTNMDTSKGITFYFRRTSAPSYSSQLGTLEDIEANYDYCLPAEVSAGDFSVSGYEITVPGGITFGDNQQAIVKFILKNEDGSATINANGLTVTVDESSYVITPASATSELYVAIPGISGKTIGLNANTDGANYTFTKSGVTFTNGRYYAITVKMVCGGVIAVDLGLPSGLKWAKMNVGASSPEEYGDYFAWGETTPQSSNKYDWTSYKWCKGSSSTLTKYCNNSSYGYNDFTDSKTFLDMEDDAARANWGGDWRMPTQAEFEELIGNTTSKWTTQNGVYGFKFTSKTNSNSIFLPAAGFLLDGELYAAGSRGHYWSSTLYESYPYDAWDLYFGSGDVGTQHYHRDSGRSVRPVRQN